MMDNKASQHNGQAYLPGGPPPPQRYPNSGILAAIEQMTEFDWGPDPLGDAVDVEHELVPVGAAEEEWAQPQPLSAADPAPSLEPYLLPSALRPWLIDAAERLSVRLEMVAIPAVVALGAALGRRLVIFPKQYDHWAEVPNLWGVIIGPPSSMKSPALRDGLRPLKDIAAQATNDYEADRLKREAEASILDAQIKRLLREAHGTAPRPTLAQEIAEANEKLEQLRRPARRFITNDPTVEMLTELLRDNPSGLLLVRDELTGLLDSFDKKGREGDREFYLQAFNSEENYTVDRIGRGTLHIPALTLSVIGGMQPGKLEGLVLGAVSGHREADGLLQRFQLAVCPEPLTEYDLVDRPIDHAAAQKANRIYVRLAEFDPAQHPELDTERGSLPGIGFDELAQERFNTWLVGHMRRLRSAELSASPAFQAHLGKYSGLVAKLALLLHLADTIESGKIPPVTLEALQRAIAWAELLEAHARKIYAPELQGLPGTLRELALRILEGDVQDGMTVRDVYRRGWRGLKTAASVKQALDYLAKKNWVRIETTAPRSSGRPSDLIRINPHLEVHSEDLIP